jgi:hypothetical protein
MIEYTRATDLAEEIDRLKAENDRLRAALLEATNQRRSLSAQHDKDQTLIDGLTILADGWQRRAIKAESSAKHLEGIAEHWRDRFGDMAVENAENKANSRTMEPG